MREINLKDEFKKVIESDWDDVQVSVDVMRQIREEEWYQDAIIELARSSTFCDGILMLMACANTELFTYEKVFLLYKLHFGSIVEQEGALNAIICSNDTSFLPLIKQVKIDGDYFQNKLNKSIRKLEEQVKYEK